MASRLEAERTLDAAMFLGPVEAVLAQTLDTEAKGGGVKRKSGKDEKEEAKDSAPPPFPGVKRRALELKAQSQEEDAEVLDRSYPSMFLSVMEQLWSDAKYTFERLATAFTVFLDSSLFGLPPMNIHLTMANRNVSGFIHTSSARGIFLHNAWRTGTHNFPEIDWRVNVSEEIDKMAGYYRQPVLNIRHLPIEDAGTPSRVYAVFKAHEDQYLAPCSFESYVHSRSEAVFEVTVFHQAATTTTQSDAEAIKQYEELAVQAFSAKNKWPGRYFLELEQRQVKAESSFFPEMKTKLRWMFTERCADHLARLMHDIAACSTTVGEFMAETQLPGYDGAQIVRGFLDDMRQRQAREPQMIARVSPSFRPQWHTESREFARYWPVEFSVYLGGEERRLTHGERQAIQQTIEAIGKVWQGTYASQVPRKRALRFVQRILPDIEYSRQSLAGKPVFKHAHSSDERKTLWHLVLPDSDISGEFYTGLTRPHSRRRVLMDDFKVSPELHAQYQYWPNAIPGAEDTDEENTKVWHIVFHLEDEDAAGPIAPDKWYDETPQLAFYHRVSKTERLISVKVGNGGKATQTELEIDPAFLAAKHLRLPSHTFAVMENGDNPVLGVCPAAIAALIRVDQEPIKELEKFAQETNMALDSELVIQSFLVGKFKA